MKGCLNVYSILQSNKDIYLLTKTGKGNMSPCAEFNVYADPEAAAVVLKEFDCPLYLVCWELSLKHILTQVSCSQ